ncbi:MAG TPA: aldo/keto reductase, partial [Acidimicrobiales bacterium]|nr:aldo/keto reductase [Acidimicrobiales bacterium]
GIPDGSRATLPGYEWLKELLTNPERNAKVRKLKDVAEELGCSLSQLSLAWCARNPHVSTVITGASSPDQVRENMGALEVLPKLDADLMSRVKSIIR